MKLRFLIATLVLTSCQTGSKRLAAIDAALTEAQPGKMEQGRGSLEKLCTEGSTGACALIGKPVESQKPLPIMQSITSTNQSRFVVVLPNHEKLNYFLRSQALMKRLQSEHFERASSPSAVDQVEAFGLDLKQPYELLVLGPDGMLWDKRSFRPLNLGKTRGRVAVTRGMDDSLTADQAKMWSQLARQRPDVIFMMGDNIFPRIEDGESGVNPDLLWQRYVETRSNLEIFKANPLIPVVAVWDALDYGKSNGDRTYRFKTESAEIFFSFFAQHKPAPGFDPGPGVASWWSAFGVHFAFMDNRSSRSPNGNLFWRRPRKVARRLTGAIQRAGFCRQW